MPVNGIELKEGQKWKTQDYGIVTIVKPGLNEEYPWKFIEKGKEKGLSITDDGKYWSDDDFPILLELVKDVPMNSTTKFNPQPGDKIICNNGEEFICCTLEFLNENGLANGWERWSIFGYQHAEDNPYTKYDWQYWDENGKEYTEEWTIREVIPQSSEVTDDKKEEPMYTVEEVLEAIQIVTPSAAPWNWAHEIKEHLNKVKDPQYMEYLRLKAIYE